MPPGAYIEDGQQRPGKYIESGLRYLHSACEMLWLFWYNEAEHHARYLQ